jgi:hypothetical protein
MFGGRLGFGLGLDLGIKLPAVLRDCVQCRAFWSAVNTRDPAREPILARAAFVAPTASRRTHRGGSRAVRRRTRAG